MACTDASILALPAHGALRPWREQDPCYRLRDRIAVAAYLVMLAAATILLAAVFTSAALA
jgi:hypothetical protein